MNNKIYAYRRKGLDYFCTCDLEKYEELSQKDNLFETKIFYEELPARPAVSLSDEEMDSMRQDSGLNFVTFREFKVIGRAIEAAVLEKNGLEAKDD